MWVLFRKFEYYKTRRKLAEGVYIIVTFYEGVPLSMNFNNKNFFNFFSFLIYFTALRLFAILKITLKPPFITKTTIQNHSNT